MRKFSRRCHAPHRGGTGLQIEMKLSDWTWGEPWWHEDSKALEQAAQKSWVLWRFSGYIFVDRYFLDISIFLGKALNGLVWPHSWTGFEMIVAIKAFWSPCHPEIFWFLEVVFCPLQFRSHAQTTQGSLHLAAWAVSVIVIQSNPLSTSHSLVHWQGPVKGPSNIIPVLMLQTEAAHVITFAQHVEIGCTKTGNKG